jgi:hypothetical protein
MKNLNIKYPVFLALILASTQALAMESPAGKAGDCSNAPLDQDFSSVIEHAAAVSQATEKLGAPAIVLPGHELAQSSTGEKPTRSE